MPDKKLTDNEIVKALECCIGDTDGKDCFGCPLYEIDDCQAHLNLAALDLITRQKAKIIKLENKNSKVRNERNRARAEAYKEFADRLCEDRVSNDPVVIAAKVELKELAGENNETKTF